MKFDYSLYLVTSRMYTGSAALGEKTVNDRKIKFAETDDRIPGALELCAAVEQAILGGCTMVQLREKEISSRDFYYLANKVKQITDKYDIPLIINDRIDIALSVGAAGVHIGQSDIPVLAARKAAGQNMLLGVSAISTAEAVRAWQDGADYLGAGAMFPTKTKSDAKPVSIEELAAIRRAVPIPVVAIGGINRENAASLMKLGIDGVAVVSAILSQPDIRGAAKELKNIF